MNTTVNILDADGKPKQKKPKVKEEKQIDYSRVPDEIWEKTLNEFIATMNDLELRVGVVERAVNRLVKFELKDK